VSITAWRITKRRHLKDAFTGTGARKYGGRWNGPGTPVIYTAETQSLAALEVLVHIEAPDLLQRYVLVGVEIDASWVVELDRSRLPLNWRAQPPPHQLRTIGDQWVAGGSSVALRVPSTLVPAEFNFLLNPAHADFKKLVIKEPISFSFDERLKR
jgi:RES domain-containing protein